MSTRECVRCAGRKRDGGRCSRRTCLYSKYCFQHAQKKKHLSIKNSTIPRAGKGLFAAADLPRGTRIPYKGEMMTRQQVDERYPGDELGEYVLCFGRGRNQRCVDARSTQSGLGRYANDNRGTRYRANARFQDPGRRERWPQIVLTRAVRKGEEIFVAYGGDYWNPV